jgi:hypothetical protein
VRSETDKTIVMMGILEFALPQNGKRRVNHPLALPNSTRATLGKAHAPPNDRGANPHEHTGGAERWEGGGHEGTPMLTKTVQRQAVHLPIAECNSQESTPNKHAHPKHARLHNTHAMMQTNSPIRKPSKEETRNPQNQPRATAEDHRRFSNIDAQSTLHANVWERETAERKANMCI